MFDKIIAIFSCLALIVIFRKISNTKLPKPLYYAYLIVFSLTIVQLYSIAYNGMTIKGVFVEPEFFHDYISKYLPNNVIELSCLFCMFTLPIFCFPKRPDDAFFEKNSLIKDKLLLALVSLVCALGAWGF
ncbi:hypothetical protein MW332_004370 [Vibrio parahaemolyticus]|nr:hypothetical protein [Vibrio parahaemolyticus]